MDRDTRGLDHGQPVWVVSRITQLPVTKRRPHPHPGGSYGSTTSIELGEKSGAGERSGVDVGV